MATRVGKYKLTKRDSALSLTDGGVIQGDLEVQGQIKFSDTNVVEGAGASLTNNRLYWTGSHGLTGSDDNLQVLVMG